MTEANESETVVKSGADILKDCGMDGRKWAAAFNETAVELGYQSMDEGWLIAWFTNSIMAGYDRGARHID